MKHMVTRAIALLLTLILVVSLMGCASKETTQPSGDLADTPTTDTSSNTEQGGKKTLKIGYCVAGMLGDQSTNDNCLQGIERFIEEYKDKFDVVLSNAEAQEFGDHEMNARNFAEQGYDLVLIGLAAENDVLVEYAGDYPDTMFWQNQGTITDIENVACTRGMPQQSNFACGYFAVKLCEALGYSTNVGWVGGQRNPALERAQYGFTAGAEYAGGSATVVYVGDFTDAAKAKELTNQMIESGIHFVMPWAGGAGAGVEQAIQAMGSGYFTACGGTAEDPNFFNSPDTSIIAATDNADVLTYMACKEFADGTLTSGVKMLGMAEGGCNVTYSPNEVGKMIPEELKEEMEQLKEQIISGELVPPSTEEEYNTFVAEVLNQ